MCRVLRVSPGGYYDRRGRPQSARTEQREALVAAIKAVHVEVKARYGSPRMHAELVARGRPCGVTTVARLMRQHGIAARTRRKFRCTTDSNHDRPVAENVLDRRFEPEGPNRACSADITSIATGEGWLYLAAVEDLYSRRIVGWSASERIDSRPVVDALEMALAGRRPRREPCGSFGPGSTVRQRALSAGAGRPRDRVQHEPAGETAGDNAPMESFLRA